MIYDYDLQAIKNSLTIDDIEQIVTELGGEPIKRNGNLICKTICHNGNSHKLYWFSNSNLFHCFTDCSTSFDIFELVQKVKSIETHSDWSLPQSVDFVAKKFGFTKNIDQLDENFLLEKDYEIFSQYDRIKDINVKTQEVELKEYDGTFLTHLPHPTIQPWINEGISKAVMDAAGICYDPKNQGIVIPHYDINNRLIGVRERTLISEQAEKYGKYMPARIGRQMYSHPLSFSLYNLNHSKNNIQRMGKAFVFEGEKSTLKYRTYFGEENDLSVSICGSSMINYQAWLLIQQGAKEIIICLDKQFQKPGDDEFKKLIKNLKNIHKKYGRYVNISYCFDKDNLLDYKDSPIDKSKEIFLDLYKNRINLY